MIDLGNYIGVYLDGPSATEALHAYLEPGRFTGAYFERLADPDPFTITANDLIAVSMLSVTIPAATAAWLLGEGRPLVSSLLREIPVDAHIADSSIDISEGSAAWELWDLIKTGNDIGTTKTSKLLAAKRPSLIPVNDSVTRALMNSLGTWDNWRAFLQSEFWTDLRPQLRRAGIDAGGAHLSDLRIIDIILWMTCQTESTALAARELMPNAHRVEPRERRR
jgi:hypothetical protein